MPTQNNTPEGIYEVALTNFEMDWIKEQIGKEEGDAMSRFHVSDALSRAKKVED